jgi:hypothetical protein
MFNLTSLQIKEFARFAYLSDCEIRSDLILGMIKDEDDYTSNFTGTLRRKINANSRKTGIKATSYLLPSPIEQSIGCDATIIIQSNGYIKIALFEAKWPRFSKSYRWDYKQTSTGLSHYSDQLDRQALQSSDFAIFEMFYCEYPFGTQPNYMQKKFHHASGIVTHLNIKMHVRNQIAFGVSLI